MTLVYISGKISGDGGFMEKFANAEEKLKAAGYRVINPARIVAPVWKMYLYDEIMEVDMSLLDLADAIVLLDDWAESEGAIKELDFALKKGINVWTIRNF